MEVEYKNLNQYPGYRVGNDGSVWSSRTGNRPPYKNGWRQLNPTVKRRKWDTYYTVCVTLRNSSGKHQVAVGRLVLEAFVGPCPEGMHCCHFPDKNPSNNRLDNLRWDTPAGNRQDQRIHGDAVEGERNGRAVLTNEKVVVIRRRLGAGERKSDLAVEYGVTEAALYSIEHRLTWKHLPE